MAIMQQLHERVAFKPINVGKLTQQEKQRAMDSLIFLVEKSDGRIKARTCANGSLQLNYIDKEEATSPTALTEAIMITAAIEADENRDIMTVDIPNAFVQTEIESRDERIIMKIKGPLATMLVSIEPEVYESYVIQEDNEKVIYVEVLKAIYGMLQASLMFYKKLRRDLEEIGFKVNPYDPYVANRIVKGKRHTITWHVDDLKSSHEDAKVNDEFHKWLDMKYGGDKLGKVRATRGKVHNYLGMTLDYSTPKKLKLSMQDYIEKMINEFPEALKDSNCPWNENVFKVNEEAEKLSKDKSELFHKFVAKGLFAIKRTRPDILPAITFLCTRVKSPNENDWMKLKQMLEFLKTTKQDTLTLEANNYGKITWHLDAAFGVHNDYKVTQELL
jgi:Reverse transcriptase (RNA-dependent DNA polymerase)